MADKVLIPGAFGLTNYRNHFSRPITGTVTVRGRGSQARPRTWARERLPPEVRNQLPNAARRNIYEYLAPRFGTATRTATIRRKPRKQYKKHTCCRYIRGKKYCSPRFCSKKFYWY